MRKFFSSIGEYFRQTDKLLLALCLFATGYGLLLLLVALQAADMQEGNTVLVTVGGLDITMQFVKQVASVLLGVLAALLISAVDYEILAACWWILAPISVILVVLTYFIGIDTGAADDKAWLMIPGIGMTFQPSELLKIAFIITFSLHLFKTQDRLNSPLNLLLLCVHGAVPVGMIMLQGDDGTALVFLFMFVVMLFAAGSSCATSSSAGCSRPLRLRLCGFTCSSPSSGTGLPSSCIRKTHGWTKGISSISPG